MALRTRRLTDDEAQYLRRLSMHVGTPARVLQRAYIVWLSAQGKRVPEIAVDVGVSEHTVRLWLTRFMRDGVDGLQDLPRPGAVRRYDDALVEQICSIASTPPQAMGLDYGSWTLDRLVTYFQEYRGITVRRSRLSQLLTSAGIRLGRASSETAVLGPA